MAKKEALSLMEQISQRTKQNIVKTRSGSGKTTYLDRFVNVLTDDEGNPTEPKTRTQIIAEISCQIVEEKLDGEKLELTESMDSEHDILVADTNRKVRNQVASAIAKNNNSTSVSYNEKYKDKYEVIKGDGGVVSLARKKAE